MDTTNRTQSASPATDQSQAQSQGNQSISTPQTPQPISISGGNKEHGPISAGNVAEYVTPHPTEAAPELPPEVVDAGVEQSVNAETPRVPEEVKQAGVTTAKESTPMTLSQATPQIQTTPLPTPMNYEEAKKEIHQGNPNNSRTWLGMLSKYVLEKFGMQKAV